MPSSLREFQLRLSEKLRQAAGAPMSAARLGVRVGQANLLVELSEVGEIVPFAGGITPVPLAHEWFRGLVNLRGSLYGVSDFACFEGAAPWTPTRAARLLAFAPRLGLNAALLIERTLGLQNMSGMREATADETDEAVGATNELAGRAAQAGRRTDAMHGDADPHQRAGGHDRGADVRLPASGWRGRIWRDAEGTRWEELSLEALATNERFLAIDR